MATDRTTEPLTKGRPKTIAQMNNKSVTNNGLSWIAALKQWRKRYKGKTYYLGTGHGKSDRAAYQRALIKWQMKKEEADREDEINKLLLQQQELQEQFKTNTDTLYKFIQVGEKRKTETDKDIEENKDEYLQQLDRRFDHIIRGETKPKPKNNKKTIADIVSIFLKEQEQRVKFGLKSPDAPKDRRLSPNRYRGIKAQIQTFLVAFGEQEHKDNEEYISKIVKAYRNQQEALVVEDKLAEGTLSQRMKNVRMFWRWAFDNHHISAIPRTLGKLCQGYASKPKAKAIDVETIRTIFNAANDRVKTSIALSLNCGFYQVDISGLREQHLKDGYIQNDRQKTGVSRKFKLWDITKQLIEKTANGKDGLLFSSASGGPLVVATLEKRSDVIAQAFRDLLKRLKITGFSFSNLRDSAATQIERMDPSLSDSFLSHVDSRMAKYYIDQQQLTTAKLDAAIDQLEKIYGLTLPD